MIAALESGKVAYYCTDFPNAKTCNAKHIIATPHLGASTRRARTTVQAWLRMS